MQNQKKSPTAPKAVKQPAAQTAAQSAAPTRKPEILDLHLFTQKYSQHDAINELSDMFISAIHSDFYLESLPHEVESASLIYVNLCQVIRSVHKLFGEDQS